MAKARRNAKTQPRIFPHTVLICDDVRREDNGKELLIGVYSAGVLVQEFPAHLMLRLWVNYDHEGEGEFPLETRLLGVDGEVIFTAAGKMVLAGPPGSGTLAIGAPVAIPGPGKLTFQMRQGSGRWTLLKMLPVKASATLAAKPVVPADAMS